MVDPVSPIFFLFDIWTDKLFAEIPVSDSDLHPGVDSGRILVECDSGAGV